MSSGVSRPKQERRPDDIQTDEASVELTGPQEGLDRGLRILLQHMEVFRGFGIGFHVSQSMYGVLPVGQDT